MSLKEMSASMSSLLVVRFHLYDKILSTFSGKGGKRERIKNMGRGSIRCREQHRLETERVQPNSPRGEWLNDVDDNSVPYGGYNYMALLKDDEIKCNLPVILCMLFSGNKREHQSPLPIHKRTGLCLERLL